MFAQQPTQGALVDGRYQLIERLGASGRGESWRALDNRFGQRPVVVRFVRETDPEALAVLDAEIARLPGLQSPFVAAVLDLGNGPYGRYIVREWVDGRSLADWIESQRMSGRAPELSAVRRLFDNLTAGASALHALPGGAALVHRGIKPTNVILRNTPGGDPVAVLVDVATTGPSRQPAGMAAGNDPGTYCLAPEQWTGRASEISPATDVFALAALLVHMLTLRNANANGDRWCVTAATFSAGLRDALAQTRLDVPARLWDVLAQAMRPEAAQRPRDATAFRVQMDPAWGAPFVPPMTAPAGPVGSTQAMDMSQYLNTLAPPTAGAFGAAPQGAFGAPPGPYASTTTAGPYRPPPSAPMPFGQVAPMQNPYGNRPSGGSSAGVLLGVFAAMGCVLAVGVGAFVFLRGKGESPSPSIERAPEGVTINAVSPGGPMLDSLTIPVGNSPVLGRNDALVTLVVFSDFQCPFCARVEPTVTQLRQQYGDNLRVVWKNNPLAFHVNARPAAEAAMEAYAEGGNAAFWGFHDLAFQNQQSLNPVSYEMWAQRLNLNVPRFHQALDLHSQAGAVALDESLARTLHVTGTPHFFINGSHLVGAQPINRFREVIDRVLLRANAIQPRSLVYRQMTADPVDVPGSAPLPPTADADANRVYNIRPNVMAPYRGGRSARVVLDHFSDLQCPFCARVNPTMNQLQAIYGDRIRIVWRDYPLAFHQNAMIAAEAAHEVFLQRGNDAFWRFHDTVFTNQRELSRASLEQWAEREGVNMPRFRAALDSHIHQSAIRADMDALTASGASIGTPVTFINGVRVSGAQPLSAFQTRIDAALSGR